MESQVITQPEKKSGNDLNEFQAAAFTEAQTQLNELQKELSTKKYLIDLKKDDIELVSKFITTDAPWKFTECLGIKEVQKELKECIKVGKFFTTAVAIEATYYYLSKVDGKGTSTNASTFCNIEDYLRILKAVTSGIEKIKIDTEKIKQAQFIVAARAEGIDTDVQAETTK